MASFSFGGSGTSGFGSAGNKSSAFGGSTSSATPAFGSTNTSTTAFTGFGTNSATGFGSTQPAVSSSGVMSFGSNTNTLGTGGLSFGSNKPASSGFSFGSNTNTGTSTGFGNTTFGTAPTNTTAGFGTSTFGTGTGTGFGSGTSNFGSGTSNFGSGTSNFGSGTSNFGTGTSNFGAGTSNFGAGTSNFGTGTSNFGTGTSNFGTGTGNFGSGTGNFGSGTGNFGTGTGNFGSGTGNFGSGTSNFGTGTSNFGAGTSNFGAGTSNFGAGTSNFGAGTSNFGAGTSNFGIGGLFGGGQKTSQSTPGFCLGTATNAFKGFGQPQQQQNTGLCPSVSLYMAVCAPVYFSDERDEVLKKWNQLQAVWGFGKGFFAPGLPPVEFSPDNEFCRFKAVGYIKMPTFSSEEGLVELVINKKESIVREQQAGLVGELCKVYGGAVQVCVEYVKPGPGDSKTRLCYYVQHRNPNGETKKANTWEVYQHLKNDQHRQTITNLCIETATPLVALTEVQLKEYLEKPPRGLDPVLWEQGKRDNPDPAKYLPVPLVGFQELQARFKAQETESTLLQGQLDKIAGDVCSMQSRLATLQDHLAECHRKQRQMAHRVLQLVVRQECARKRGVPITSAEEKLRLRLDNLQSQLHAPTQYMGKLNELLSQMSAQGSNGASSVEENQLSADTEADVKEFLSWQQDGISEVVAILKSDMKALEAMVKSKGK